MNIKQLLNKIFIWVVFIAVFSTGGYFLFTRVPAFQPVTNNLLSSFRSYPEVSNPKEITLTCDYHGKNLSVTETLYGSIAEFYRSEPKKNSAFQANDNQAFVFSYPEDNEIDSLVEKITVLGDQNSLNDDQVVDLAGCLLQSIPYDNEKATKILSTDFEKYSVKEIIPRYPYETLYDFKGVCSDKSFLGAAVLSKMGYGTSLLVFEEDKHLSLGVSVPLGYESFTNTTDGILELTGTGFLVGDIPEIDTAVGIAENTFEKIQTESTIEDMSRTKLSSPSEILQISKGKAYQRIVERTELKNSISLLYEDLQQEKYNAQNAKDAVEQAENELKAIENDYRSKVSGVTYADYLKAYNSYVATYNSSKKIFDAYNSMVNKYNVLIEQYQSY